MSTKEIRNLDMLAILLLQKPFFKIVQEAEIMEEEMSLIL